MIRLGYFGVSIYPNNGVQLELQGSIVFRGHCHIGNNSFISVGPKGRLVLGEGFRASSSLKLVVCYSVLIHDNVLVGWDSIIMDSNFHRLKRLDGKSTGKGYGSVEIEENVWIGNNVEVTSGSIVPHHSVVQACSLVLKRMEQKPYSIYGGNPAILVAEGYFYDLNDDVIIYQ